MGPEPLNVDVMRDIAEKRERFSKSIAEAKASRRSILDSEASLTSNHSIDLLGEEDEADVTPPKEFEESRRSTLSETPGMGHGQAALRRVLFAYSMYDSEVGYCQGMNFITAMFLTFLSEEESFWLLVDMSTAHTNFRLPACSVGFSRSDPGSHDERGAVQAPRALRGGHGGHARGPIHSREADDSVPTEAVEAPRAGEHPRLHVRHPVAADGLHEHVPLRPGGEGLGLVPRRGLEGGVPRHARAARVGPGRHTLAVVREHTGVPEGLPLDGRRTGGHGRVAPDQPQEEAHPEARERVATALGRRRRGGGARVLKEGQHRRRLVRLVRDAQLRLDPESHAQFAVLLHNVLSPDECAEMIDRAEEAGFHDASIYDRRTNQAHRNCTRYISDDAALADNWFERIMHALKDRPALEYKLRSASFASNKNEKLNHAVGINERLRLLRYRQGEFFHSHNDAKFIRGADQGERAGETSYVSVLIYLNHKFKGGTTRFHGNGRQLDVKPRTGSILVHEHNILHSGQRITSGKKYIVRTDVMYSTTVMSGRFGPDGPMGTSPYEEL
ncbi:hypothetical protein THAOC_08363 [Thalassiosira oceanica]|uniref:Fe2OG dioxygenase domain-containing protein n=1 Tax=Thalassiosira oceanica TaxID=159749 RepID=K0TA77_THAOC|nr:hypothetical protein THAOC_08363 [Thalassiosira oceanica]|eukprot:EJK70291.1 hypothetical protein THAOC_08363 [Thalassiosira oceanica]